RVTLALFAGKSRPRNLSTTLAPRSNQRFGFGVTGFHDEVTTLARLADIVRFERETNTLRAAPAAFETQMAPPSAVVVPDVMIRPVFAVGQFYNLVHAV
ncbi:MAG: hypothetical protein ACO3XN_06285, partial [Chthoniobacterales bacterium]